MIDGAIPALSYKQFLLRRGTDCYAVDTKGADEIACGGKAIKSVTLCKDLSCEMDHPLLVQLNNGMRTSDLTPKETWTFSAAGGDEVESRPVYISMASYLAHA